MKTLTALIAVTLVSFVLSSCGGEPKDYDKNTDQSVFVWRQTAFAEHPAVENDGDLGTPKSTRKALIGKSLTVTYTVNGVARMLVVEFTSQTRCIVHTDEIAGMIVHYPGASYNYKIDDADGKKATLIVSYDTDITYYQFTLKLEFQNAFNSAPTTFQEYRGAGGVALLPAGTAATTSQWALTPQ